MTKNMYIVKKEMRVKKKGSSPRGNFVDDEATTEANMKAKKMVAFNQYRVAYSPRSRSKGRRGASPAEKEETDVAWGAGEKMIIHRGYRKIMTPARDLIGGNGGERGRWETARQYL